MRNKFLLVLFILQLLLTSCTNNVQDNTNGTEDYDFDIMIDDTTSVDTTSTDTTESSSESESVMESNCRLIVKGKDITDCCYVYLHNEEKYAELPLVEIFEALGAVVEWKNDECATIVYNDVEYTLDIVNNSLFVDGNYRNYIAFLPGNPAQYSCYRVNNGHYMVDNYTVNSMLRNISDVYIHIDYDSSTINIH